MSHPLIPGKNIKTEVIGKRKKKSNTTRGKVTAADHLKCCRFSGSWWRICAWNLSIFRLNYSFSFLFFIVFSAAILWSGRREETMSRRSIKSYPLKNQKILHSDSCCICKFFFPTFKYFKPLRKKGERRISILMKLQNSESQTAANARRTGRRSECTACVRGKDSRPSLSQMKTQKRRHWMSQIASASLKNHYHLKAQDGNKQPKCA